MDESKRIGELLLDAGLVTAAQLQAGLTEQRRSGGRLCSALVRLGHLDLRGFAVWLTDQFGVSVLPPTAETGAGVLELDEEAAARHVATSGPPPGGFSPEDWLRRFVLQSVRRRSREIHLEAVEEGLRSRFRVRGELLDGETAPLQLQAEITRHALALAGVSAGVGPAEGRFRILVRNRWLRATLSAFPTINGARIVIKIVEESRLAQEFQELGMSKEVADEAQRLLGYRHGVLLVNAPPGQGRHTTFYSFLSVLRGEKGRNVMTLESQVRFPVPGISHTQVGGGSGMDFAGGLQTIMRQEPDVVGISDLTDHRTLEMVMAAGRRCYVVALCDFSDNQQALEWIREAGIGASTMGQLLRGVLAQRLLPKICSACREPLLDQVPLIEGIRGRRPEDLSFYTGSGCEHCGGTGRVGRVAIFELLSFREELRDRLMRGDPSRMLVEEAQRLGMWSLREEGILKASQGLVDLRDVLECTGLEEQQPG